MVAEGGLKKNWFVLFVRDLIIFHLLGLFSDCHFSKFIMELFEVPLTIKGLKSY